MAGNKQEGTVWGGDSEFLATGRGKKRQVDSVGTGLRTIKHNTRGGC